MELRNQKGINVITLSVAVIILVIITSVLVYSSKDGVKMRNLKDMYNDIELLENKISAYYVQHGDLPKIDTPYTNSSFIQNANYEEVNPNNGSTFYIIDLKELEGITLNYGKDYETIRTNEDSITTEFINSFENVYIVNEASHTVYYPRGIQFDGITYYTYGEEWKKVDLTVIPIENAEHLRKIGSGEQITIEGNEYTFSPNATYILKSDIDLSEAYHEVDGTPTNDISWTPIGTPAGNNEQVIEFSGKFYGNNHSIVGLYINTTKSNQGLIVSNKGTIKDLTVEGKIISTGNIIGGIAALNYGEITNSSSKVEITCQAYAGGIAGKNYKNIVNCKNFKKIKGTQENSDNGEIGGIVGINYASSLIEKSYSEGSIVAKSNNVGGIAGTNQGIINLCINNGPVTSQRSAVGGIAGYVNNINSKITNCYNVKAISNPDKTGGIIGELLKGQALNCYSIGIVNGTTNNKSIIGLKADTETTVRNLFFLSTLATTDENATSKTEVEMKAQAFVSLLNTGQTNTPWTADTNGYNDSYPILSWQLDEL